MTDDKLVQRSLYLTDEEWAFLKKSAKANNRSTNNFVRQWVQDGIAEEEQE